MSYKIKFYITFIILIAGVLFLIGKRLYWSYFKNQTKYPYSQERYIKATADAQAQLPIDSTDIVFVGNSLTANFPLNEMFGTLTIKNRGVGSNTTSHIVQRIESIIRYKPRKIFLEGGINDILTEHSLEETFSRYRNILEIIKEQSPRTKIYVQSTLPVGREMLPAMPAVDSLNKLVKHYCDSAGITYIDLHPVFRKGHELDSLLTWDGVHLNIEGYRKWKEAVRGYLTRSQTR